MDSWKLLFQIVRTVLPAYFDYLIQVHYLFNAHHDEYITFAQGQKFNL